MTRDVRPRGRRWARLRAQVKARRELCCRCQQPIDYALAYPDPGSFSVDHYPFPISTHPHLAWDPGNLHAAHLDCNQAAVAKRPAPGLGNLSEDW
jgi:5-methylcytosine-specific restriction endonuclease McrA